MKKSDALEQPVAFFTQSGEELFTVHSLSELTDRLTRLTASHSNADHPFQAHADWPACTVCGALDPEAPGPNDWPCDCTLAKHAASALRTVVDLGKRDEEERQIALQITASSLGLKTDQDPMLVEAVQKMMREAHSTIGAAIIEIQVVRRRRWPWS